MTKPLTMQCSEKWTPAWLRDGLGSGFGDRDGKGTFGPELLFGYAPENFGISLFSKGGDVMVKQVKGWKMKSCYAEK